MLSLATFCAYYTPLDLTSRHDPHADALMLQAVEPVIHQLYHAGGLTGFSFMRFSERGYHVRMFLTGEEDYLREHAVPALQASVAAHIAANPALTAPLDHLAPISQVLNRKLGHDLDAVGLLAPGTILIDYAPVPDAGPDREHETEDVLLANLELHNGLCLELFNLLALAPTMRERKLFVRQLIDDALRLAPLRDRDRFMITQRIKSSWIEFFELRPDVLLFYRTLYERQAPDFQQFLTAKLPLDGSLAVLPERLHEVYRRMYTLMETLLPRVVVRSTGEYTARDGNRLVGVYHLMHNRLSLGIEEEVYLSMILGNFYYNRLAPADVAIVEEKIGGAHAARQLL